jgi:GAF domain-containing protein
MHDHDALDFAELAAALQAAPTPTDVAEDIVGYVRAQLDADLAGISIIRPRDPIETIAATDPLVQQLDRLQSSLADGPCYASGWPGQTLTVPNLAEDERWSTWGPEATALGIASLLATELTTAEGHRFGSINAYWTQPRGFSQDDIAFMAIFARHATLALEHSWNIAGLNVALDSRKLIGQAQGLLMERYDLDEARAFEELRRYSQDHNIKLRRVAEDLVTTRKLPSAGGVAENSMRLDAAG